MIVANFTDEAMVWTHEGISGKIDAGKVVEMPENRARFILNKLGHRGLVQLEYNEDPSYKTKKKAESQALNKRFWVYQVENHNHHNESLKAANKSYVRPTDEIINAAEKFGIELVGPWKTKPAEVKGVDNDEVKELRSQVEQLTILVMQLVQAQTTSASLALSAKQEIEVDPHPEDAEPAPESSDNAAGSSDISSSYKSLPRKQLEPWIKANITAISDWSAEDLGALADRYQKLCNKPLNLKNYEG